MEMPVVPFLICFPFLVSILMYCIRVNKIRNVIAYISAELCGGNLIPDGAVDCGGMRVD